MNAKRVGSLPKVRPATGLKPVAAAMAGIGFAAALLAPAPVVVAAEPAPAVVARDIGREPIQLAQALANEALNDPQAIGIRSRGSRAKALVPLTVTSAADTLTTPGTSGTLREVLSWVSSNCSYGTDVYQVGFAIPGPGPHTISTNSGFSATCQNVVIDGYSQAGSSPNTLPAARDGSNAVIQVVLDGSGMTGGNLLDLGGSNSTVRGLALVNWPSFGNAVHVSGSGSIVAGNFIGVGAAGTGCSVTAGTSKVGVGDGGFGTAIGGVLPADRNVIGCATGNGITTIGSNAAILGNIIGAAKDAATPAGNQGHGVFVQTSAGPIGAQGISEGNLIAYNNQAGVSFGCFPGVVSGNDIFLNSLTGIDSFVSTPTDTVVVTYAGGNTSVNYSVTGFAANQNVMTEFFDNSDLLLGLDQGQRYFASCALFTNFAGSASCTATVPGIYKNLTRTFTAFNQTTNFYGPVPTPDMVPSTTTYDFGTIPVGGSSAVTPLTISNPGPGDLFVDAMSLSLGDYRDTTGGAPPNSAHWCGIGSDASGAPLSGPSAIPVLSGTNCVLNLVFTPQNSGARNATLTLIDAQSPANGTVINLQGSGSVTPPTVNWTFNPVSVLQNAASTLRLSITNPNGAAFTNPNFTYNLPANLVVAASPNASTPLSPCAGSFTPLSPGVTSFTVNGLSVPTGGTCDFTVDVSSGTVGSYPVSMAAGAIVGAVLAVPVSNAASNTAILTVNPPAAPAVQLTPGGLNFGSVTVGTPAPPQSALLQNVGTANLVFSGISLTPGDFTQTNTCPTGLPGLPPGGNCAFAVNFTPTATGTRSADITIATNAATSPNILPLTGNGVAVPVAIPSLLPSALTFPTQTVGTTSAAQSVTLSNAGTAPLAIASIITEGDFAQSNACPSSLAPSASCGISVTFSPVAPGSRSGFLKVFDDAAGSPHFIPLTGTATLPPVPTISAPTSVSFPPTQVGGVSPPVTVTISNVGGGPLSIAAVEIVGSGYAVSSQSCTSAPVAPSGSCTISITFAPGSAGNVIATLRLVSNAPASPTLIGLTGEGTALAVGTLAATPATLDFGTREIGTTTAAQSITVSNAGSAPVTVSGVTASGDYAQSNNCSLLESGGTCTISVTFTPTATGPRPGSVSVASNASNSPFSMNLSGTGAPIQAPVIELSASSLGFGNRLVGAGAQVQSVTVRNKGGAPLALGSITLTGEFVHTTTCGTTVEPDGTCRIDVGFLPTIPGARLGRMTVTSNASNGTQFVDLAGTGCRFTFFNRTQSLICQ
ncbi:MAG: choice-of-anchor D domain-containing protein [Burkholderiales bacterium]|nr:choice-of-anchor D domain-containing protein [Burkholderiales bacterium]